MSQKAPLTLTLILMLTSAASAATLRVPSEYPTIQAAIDAADPLDTILVANGTYKGPGNVDVDFGGKDLIVRSEGGCSCCGIDCEGSAVAEHRAFNFQSGETLASVIEGFTISNGYMQRGGAIRVSASAVTIRDCVIRDNHASDGGGICVVAGGTLRLSDSTVRSNRADSKGGALHAEHGNLIIDDTVFTGNQAYVRGGAFYMYGGDVKLLRCVVAGNYSADAAGGGNGVGSQVPFRIEDCQFVGNLSNGNCAGLIAETAASVERCVFAGNTTPMYAGGLWPSGGEQRVANCLVAGNFAGTGSGGVIVSAMCSLVNTTVVGNSASYSGGGIGIFNAGTVLDLQNCVLWGNDAPLGPQLRLNELYGNAVVNTAYSDFEGGKDKVHVDPGCTLNWGDGMIDADPLFLGGPSGVWSADGSFDSGMNQVTLTDATASWAADELVGMLVQPDVTFNLQYPVIANTATTMTIWADWSTINSGNSSIKAGDKYQLYDYHLTQSSPCIDTGDPAFVPLAGETDLDGEYRLWDGDAIPGARVDMGADEFDSFRYGDINCDARIDFGDINPFVLALTDPVGYGMQFPDCNVILADINGDGKVDFGDINPFVAVLVGS